MNFKLEIITPEKQFLETQAEAVTVKCPDGELTVLKGHQPMIAAISIGELKIKENGQWRSAIGSQGFMEVRPDEVIIFTQACEWPEEVDEARALRAKERALEKLRQKPSIYESKHAKVSLARAMARLSAIHKRK